MGAWRAWPRAIATTTSRFRATVPQVGALANILSNVAAYLELERADLIDKLFRQ